MKYVYIDESGDLGKMGSNYLVLSALIVSNPGELDRIIKNMRRNKFKKELKSSSEIKANKSSGTIIMYMLEKLNLVKNSRVLYVVLEKKKLFSEYLSKDKNKLYNYVAGKLAKQILFNDSSVEIRIDRRYGKQLLQQNFNNYFMKCLNENSNPIKVRIEHSYSNNFSGLQFADVLAWSCFQKFEHENNSFVEKLKIEQEVYHVW